VKLLAFLVPIWAFWGMVSCDDQAAVEARVRTEVHDSQAFVHCQEPRVWHQETHWFCTSDLRGERSCYSLGDHTEAPAKVSCPHVEQHTRQLELPP
jgi:hypothetical protein